MKYTNNTNKLRVNRRVLVIINTMDLGGAETFIMKLLRALDRDTLQLDFLINKPGHCYYEKEINSLGGNVYRGYAKSRHPFKCLATIFRVIKKYDYKYVTFLSEHPLVVLDVLAARLAGSNRVLVRSSTSDVSGMSSRIFAHIFRPFVTKVATHCIAPSIEAGLWMFGKKAIRNNRVGIMKNGLDIEKYAFNYAKRSELRLKYKLGEGPVYGHIGRFNVVKNHEFIIDIFAKIIVLEPEAKLILIGEGDLRGTIENKVKSLHLESSVIFTGIQSDILPFLMAMDVMIFPSYYEGMPNVIIEAQAASLPCLISSTITSEVMITDLVKALSLKDTAESWAINAISLKREIRNNVNNILIQNGYSIRDIAEFFTSLFISGKQDVY